MNSETNRAVFKVSVIIPVFNLSKYLSEAVVSAVNLAEVGEVIIVEDGSSDDSLSVCNGLGAQYDKVKVLQHPNGENRGVSASRNLGITKASCEYIAFLDADDCYLPHRFRKDIAVFTLNPQADAAYSCTILEEDQNDKENKRYGVKYDPRTKLEENVTPLEFYAWKLRNRLVLYHTDSITLKKDFLIQHKCFDIRLRLHQDSELWNRLMRRGNFYAAEWENPVAIVRRHPGNRITQRSPSTNLTMLAVMMENIGCENLHEFEKQYLSEQFLRNESKQFRNHWRRRLVYYSKKWACTFQKEQFLKKKMRKYTLD